MKLISILFFIFLGNLMAQTNFLDSQLAYLKVKNAEAQFDASLLKLFSEKSLNFPSKQIYLRAFKQEQILEVWASDDIQFKLIKTYKFTASSGKSGPKNKEGDRQIPEGFYQIETFNPDSKFHLSIKINYPNQADSNRNKSVKSLGGDIYIHGSNQTVGCIPIGDENITELYWLCAKSYNENSIIPVHIFPCKMEEKNTAIFYKTDPDKISFWNSIQPMYRFFQSHKMLGEVVGSDSSGNYQLAIPWD